MARCAHALVACCYPSPFSKYEPGGSEAISRRADALENDRGTIQKRRGLFNKDRELSADAAPLRHTAMHAAAAALPASHASEVGAVHACCKPAKRRLRAQFAVRPMMYGYGDSDQPLPETVDLVEVCII